MNYKEITELIKLVNKTDLAEFKMKDKDFELQIRTKKYHKEENSQPQMMHSMPMMASTHQMAPVSQQMVQTDLPGTPEPGKAEAPSKKVNLLEVRSPIVGTFYRSSGPDKAPFVKVGDDVSKGDVVCIIEAMKLFNEIESEVSGKVVKIMVEDASPVEYDQVLFLIEP